YTNGSISVVSEHSLSVVTTISLGSGTDPEGLAVDPSTHQLWISEPGTGEPGTGVLAEVDGATCNSTDQSDCKPDSIDLSSDPVGLAVDPSTSTVYVTLPGADEIDVVDESTLAAVGAAAAYEEPAEVTVDASTNTVFYTSYEQGGVGTFSGAGCDAASVLDCPTSATGLLATGDGPVGIALDAATNSLYVANSGSDTVSVLPTSLSSVTATVDTSLDGPLSVALDPEGNGVLVAAEGSSTGAAGILVISTATNTVTRVITGIDTGIAVASDPVDGFAWVADEGLNTTTATGGVAWLPLFVSVEDPSGQPFVTGVGGTDLTKLGPAPAQSAWDEPLSAEGASTGGISAWWTMPKYQYGPGVVSSFSSGVPCGATAGTFCRELPDVSASADPRHGYVIVFGGKWSVVGGTSAAAPLWAALTALLDAYKGKVHRLGFLNPALYKLAAEGKPILNGVTAGDNDYTTTNEGLYPAAPRYNMATGLGTPIVTALAKALG
ncbi:MAG TPA: hypothetical protein VEH29_11305, partial [Acidimicrobiales bacterium]|nr:hypothetical protein [Acidimicrobiales bacterium]